MKKGRFIIAVLTSLLDEALIVVAILWGLPQLGIHIPLYGTILICSGFVVFAVVSYVIGSRVLVKRPVPGFTDLVGLEGRVVIRLNTEGTVKISGELWNAKTETGEIEVDTRIIVVNQKGLKLIVRRQKP